MYCSFVKICMPASIFNLIKFDFYPHRLPMRIGKCNYIDILMNRIHRNNKYTLQLRQDLLTRTMELARERDGRAQDARNFQDMSEQVFTIRYVANIIKIHIPESHFCRSAVK